MRRFTITLVALLISAVAINAAIINVPDDQPTIQTGIDVAVDGDTVLVHSGTYYENINYNGKNIVIGSLFLTTQDTSYIDSTVIDGEGGTAVAISNGEGLDAILIGFTIQNGGNGISIAHSYPQIIHNKIKNNTSCGINCTESRSFISNNLISDNALGIRCQVGVEDSPILTIASNTIKDNGAGIMCWNDSPIIRNNIIRDNENYGIYCEESYSEITTNIIVANGKGIEITFFCGLTIVHNTISHDDVGIYFNPCGQPTFAWIENSINYGNGISFDINFAEEPTYGFVGYCCIEGEIPAWLTDQGGNIYTDPLFVGNYNLQWDEEARSPCIDAGDPDTDWDEDETPPDMGAIPAIEHDFDGRTLKPKWTWISFPILDTLADNNTDALFVLDSVLDNMEICKGKNNDVWYDGVNWHNDIGNFYSVDGYKINMNASDKLHIPGFLEDPDAVITLEPEIWNWIGYFLSYSQRPEDAFPDSIWNDYLTYIKGQYWSMFKWNGEWIGDEGTLNYGELYTVKSIDECSFSWEDSGEQVDPYEREGTDYFSFEEKADYEPIMVDTVYGQMPEEIGVFVGDECIGASKVNEYPVQVLAYIEDDTTGSKDGQSGVPLSFQLYYSNKGLNQVEFVKRVKVLDFETSNFVDNPVYLSSDEFAIVRLNVSGEPVPELESIDFTLSQNYPNPFNPETVIRYTIPEDSKVELSIYNAKGQLVRRLVQERQKKGSYKVIWDGKDDRGAEISSGLYLYQIKANARMSVKKMLIIK